jgi:hypothetical protein
MSIGLGFKRKAGEVGSAAYNKISNGNNDKITKKSTSIVSGFLLIFPLFSNSNIGLN